MMWSQDLEMVDANLFHFQESQQWCKIGLFSQDVLGFTNNYRCKYDNDGTLCWMATNVSVLWSFCNDAVRQENATRQCLPNDTWATADYSRCPQNAPQKVFDIATSTSIPWPKNDYDSMLTHRQILYYIYMVGYSVSLLLLLIALFFFFKIKPKDMRLKIHNNLTASMTMYNMLWLLYSALFEQLNDGSQVPCIVWMMVLKFLMMAAFCWMFIEGVYLSLKVLVALRADELKLWMCILIGWGIPVVFLLLAGAVKALYGDDKCVSAHQHKLDYIFVIPIILILLVNLVLLCSVMYVLSTKLREEETSNTKRYLKTLRALLILCPLLGTSYLLAVIRPKRPEWLYLVISYYVAIISATQGVLVAVLFCFQSPEVSARFGGYHRIVLRRAFHLSTSSSHMTRSSTADTMVHNCATTHHHSLPKRNRGQHYKNVRFMDESGKMRCLSTKL